jgi:hypothetical protein
MRTWIAIAVMVSVVLACTKPTPQERQPAPGPQAKPAPAAQAKRPAPAVPEFSYAILRHDTPKEMSADSVVLVTVRVKNTSTRAWPVRGPIQLGFYWTGQKGQRLPKEEGRALAPKEVAPDSSVAFRCRVKAPNAPGPYVLVWDMIEPGVWFGSKGAKLLRIPVHVR